MHGSFEGALVAACAAILPVPAAISSFHVLMTLEHVEPSGILNSFTCQTVLDLVAVSGPPRATSRMAGSSSAVIWRDQTSRYARSLPTVLMTVRLGRSG